MIPADTSAGALSTTAVSRATGYSVQQIRDLEAVGVISPAPRSANGYRQFAPHHAWELRTYRDLALAVGPVVARRAMRDIRTLAVDEAAALVSSFYAALNRERDEALTAQNALRDIQAEAATDAAPVVDDAMTITELANALGVRASTLRFWEKAGLLSPERVTTRAGTARRYPLPAIRDARIITALRSAGYRIPDVDRAMTALHNVRDIGESLDALEARIDAIAQRTLALLRAGTAVAEIIGQNRQRVGTTSASSVGSPSTLDGRTR